MKREILIRRIHWNYLLMKIWGPLALGAWVGFTLLFLRLRIPVFLQLQWLAILLVASRTVRSLSLLHLGALFVLGASLVPLFSIILIQPPASGAVDWVVPLAEEALKLGPLLVLFFLKGSRLRFGAGLSDFLLSGAAVGGGFSLAEDFLLGWGWARWQHLLYGPHIGPFYLFPNSTLQDWSVGGTALPIVFPGQGTNTALLALALGAALIYGRKKKMPLLWGSWLIVTVLVLAGHMFFNATSDGPLQGGAAAMQWLLGFRGHLFPWLLWAGLAAAVFWDRRCLQVFYSRYPQAHLDPLKLRRSRWNQKGSRGRFWVIRRGIHRRQRFLAYAEIRGVVFDSTQASLDAWKEVLERPAAEKTILRSES